MSTQGLRLSGPGHQERCVGSRDREHRINKPGLAEEVLREGQADLVTMARALLADPDLPTRPCRANKN